MIQHVCCNSRLVRLSLVAIRTRSSSHRYEKRVSGSVSCWSLLLAVTSEENRGKIVSVVILDAVRPTCRPEERSGKKGKGFERRRSLIPLHGRLTETVCRKADRETVIAFGSLSDIRPAVFTPRPFSSRRNGVRRGEPPGGLVPPGDGWLLERQLLADHSSLLRR